MCVKPRRLFCGASLVLLKCTTKSFLHVYDTPSFKYYACVIRLMQKFPKWTGLYILNSNPWCRRGWCGYSHMCLYAGERRSSRFKWALYLSVPFILNIFNTDIRPRKLRIYASLCQRELCNNNKNNHDHPPPKRAISINNNKTYKTERADLAAKPHHGTIIIIVDL